MTLTDTQRQHLERRLQEERARALSTLNRSIEDTVDDAEETRTGDTSSMPTHAADLGTDTMQQELDASNATRISRELAEIDAALERLFKNPEQFGICENTGKPIPFERLEMIPWARCVDREKPA